MLSIGILVDDSIVILENILRHLARGEPPPQAAINGRAEIGLAALAITLVDVVIFAPVGLVSGQIGVVLQGIRLHGRRHDADVAGGVVHADADARLEALEAAARVSEHGGGPLGGFARWWDRGFAGLERRYGRAPGLEPRPPPDRAAGRRCPRWCWASSWSPRAMSE